MLNDRLLIIAVAAVTIATLGYSTLRYKEEIGQLKQSIYTKDLLYQQALQHVNEQNQRVKALEVDQLLLNQKRELLENTLDTLYNNTQQATTCEGKLNAIRESFDKFNTLNER